MTFLWTKECQNPSEGYSPQPLNELPELEEVKSSIAMTTNAAVKKGLFGEIFTRLGSWYRMKRVAMTTIGKSLKWLKKARTKLGKDKETQPNPCATALTTRGLIRK